MESLLQELESKELTLGSVESMTGGLFASQIAGIPGASKVFKGSIVTYSSEIKEKVVNVNPFTITMFGVVSEQVAKEMAEKGRKLLGVDVCVSVTGNAGPTTEPGGKPVGCFYVAVATKNETYVEMFQKFGTRNEIRNNAVLAMRDLVHLKSI